MPKNGKHHLSDRKDRVHLLRSRFAWWSPLFALFISLWSEPVDPCFVDGHETMQKLLITWASSSPICHSGYNPRILLRCLLSQLSSSSSVSRLTIRVRELLSRYSPRYHYHFFHFYQHRRLIFVKFFLQPFTRMYGLKISLVIMTSSGGEAKYLLACVRR